MHIIRSASRVTLAVLFIFAGFASLFADSSLDLNSRVYRSLDRWQVRGLLDPLPLLRPYPPQLLRASLLEVAAHGTQADKALAAELLAGLGMAGGEPAIRALPGLDSEVRLGDGEYFSRLAPTLGLRLNPHRLVSAVAEYRLFFLDRTDGPAMPRGYRSSADWIEDWSDVEVFGRRVDIRSYLRSDLAIGNDEVFAQAGLGRTSMGPFFDDGPLISDQAPGAARFSFAWRAGPATLEYLFMPITASDDFGRGRYPEKYLFTHTLRLHPTDWVELGIIETVIYGERFEPLYFVPLSSLFLNQGLLGFKDNSLLGVYAVATLSDQVRIPFVVYADDVHFNDIARLDFDTKYKLSANIGVDWYPEFDILEKLSADYLLVTPYMYTHWDEQTRAPGYDLNIPNYSNYTHLGSSIGPSLEPNSDRLTLDARLAVLAGLDLGLRFRHIRHGNASEGLGVPNGDGTIFDPGYINNTPTFQDETRFLTQEVLERVTQVGFDLDYRLPFTSFGSVVLNGGYLFEHTQNADLVEGEQVSRHLVNLGLSYRW